MEKNHEISETGLQNQMLSDMPMVGCPLRPGAQGFFRRGFFRRERQASHEAINVIDTTQKMGFPLRPDIDAYPPDIVMEKNQEESQTGLQNQMPLEDNKKDGGPLRPGEQWIFRRERQGCPLRPGAQGFFRGEPASQAPFQKNHEDLKSVTQAASKFGISGVGIISGVSGCPLRPGAQGFRRKRARQAPHQAINHSDFSDDDEEFYDSADYDDSDSDDLKLEETGPHIYECTPLYKAAISDDWEAAQRFFEEKKIDLDVPISLTRETALHIAVGNSSNGFVEKLIDRITTQSGNRQMLRARNRHGETPLQHAGYVGNTLAAKLLINQDSEMSQLRDSVGNTALKWAAKAGRKETLCYLLEVTKDVVDAEDGTSPYRGVHGAELLIYAIAADFYDVALYLVNKYPDLVMETQKFSKNGLARLATKPNAFKSGSRLGFLQGIIYKRIPVNREKASEGITNQNLTKASCYGSNVSFWSMLQYLAPQIKQLHDSKVKHIQAEELVKQMCSIVMDKVRSDKVASNILGAAILPAVKHGIHELMQQCLHHFPALASYKVEGGNFVLAAIRERQENIYNLVYQMSGFKAYVSQFVHGKENALHVAGMLAPPHRLNKVTGAALQMQRELQWFKEIETFVHPRLKESLNKELKTPRMVFTDAHKELLKEAQQWMKDTSSSATVVAALIITVAFAAIFTAPGGNNDSGKPLFLNDGVFILFVISDAVALFSSSSSVLMFLSILTSRFAEDDFLYALPKRLTIGLISLFISLSATMVAFSATLSLMLRDKIQWIAAPVILLASVPVTLFMLLQYPLLVELVGSTYGRGIFYKQNDLLLH